MGGVHKGPDHGDQAGIEIAPIGIIFALQDPDGVNPVELQRLSPRGRRIC